ncbi:hypothetical protein KIN20_000446 [Parelaphostrongylus tenuis]|uniref:Uncharacterized protein n=1 Tax=Parelaphostrongylus tenuis TaxID=148309 RepID=A0AAD5MDM7_PARTN|nr:hypothetical protein KIN20_000446 [Parelaphostrongylus tenuis]
MLLTDRMTENSTTSFKIVVEAVFLGVTRLNLTLGDERLPPFDIRVLRSNHDETIKVIFTVSLIIFVIIISVMMGTQLEVRRIMDIARKPIGPIIGLVCQFGIMPMIGFLLAEYGLPKDATSLKMALFAASTCPGGGKSSFWTIILGGNLDLSISMTFTQTLAALLMMPLWLSTLGKHFTSVHVRIPFGRIIEGLVGMMIPSAMGMILAHYRPQYNERFRIWIKRASWVASIVLLILFIYANHYMFWLLTWPMVICGCSLPWLGYITAFIVALVLGQSFKNSLTIAIETGIQNLGIAMLLMMWCLPAPESDIAITILFVTSIMTDKPLMIIWLVSRIYMRCCKNDTVSDNNEKDEKSGDKSMVSMTSTISSFPIE